MVQRIVDIGARIAGFVKREPVFSVALVLALASLIAVPPSTATFGYIKWNTLGLLLSFMLCVAGLQNAGVFSHLARSLVSAATHQGTASTRAIVAILIALPFFGAMFITNDVALLTFVPFAIVLLLGHGQRRLVPLVLTLQTIAANAGSYLTPFGNPHNLLCYTLFDVPFGEFILTMAPITCTCGALLAVCVGVCARGTLEDSDDCGAGASGAAAAVGACDAGAAVGACGAGVSGAGMRDAGVNGAAAAVGACGVGGAVGACGAGASGAEMRGAAAGGAAANDVKVGDEDAMVAFAMKDTIIFAGLFAISVLAVVKVLPLWCALLIVAAVVLVRNRTLFAQVDWLLLGTFVCFFIFSGNLASIPQISSVLTNAMAHEPFWITVGASQVISNVPACTLLAPFTNDWAALAAGANIGGLGSPIGSLASLITLGFYRRQCCTDHPDAVSFGRFMRTFLAFNVMFLAASCALWTLLW